MEKADRPMLDGSETGSKRILGSGNSLSKGGEAVWWVERLKSGEWGRGAEAPSVGKGKVGDQGYTNPLPFSLRSCLLFPMSRARIHRSTDLLQHSPHPRSPCLTSTAHTPTSYPGSLKGAPSSTVSPPSLPGLTH